MEYEIREACPEDGAQLIEYVKKIGGETNNLTFGSEGMVATLEQETELLKSQQIDPKSTRILAWNNGEIIGDGILRSMPRRMNHRVEMGLSVAKDYWNQGVGQALLDRLIEYAREHDIEIIQLDVRSDNVRATHIYEKYGFRKIGNYPRFLKIGSEYVDFDMMVLQL